VVPCRAALGRCLERVNDRARRAINTTMVFTANGRWRVRKEQRSVVDDRGLRDLISVGKKTKRFFSAPRLNDFTARRGIPR